LLEYTNDGPLFCEKGKDGSTTGPAQGVYKRKVELVRSVVRDPKVQPNHAWHYTFKTYGYEAGLDPLTLDAVCGHAPKTKGQDYTKVTLKKRMEAMAAFPYYQMAPISGGS
jgi:integrase